MLGPGLSGRAYSSSRARVQAETPTEHFELSERFFGLTSPLLGRTTGSP